MITLFSNFFLKLFNLEVIFFLLNTEETQTWNFLYVVHVNRVFQACIHDGYQVDRLG